MSLSTLLTYVKKHAGVDSDTYHLFKTMTYFRDADQEPQPEMTKNVSWKVVKQFFTQEVKKLKKKRTPPC